MDTKGTATFLPTRSCGPLMPEPLLLQGNVYPLAADQVVLLGAPTTKALADTAAFLKEQKKVDAVLPDYAPSVNATFVTQ